MRLLHAFARCVSERVPSYSSVLVRRVSPCISYRLLGASRRGKAASGQTRSQRALERALGCGCLLLAIGSIGLVFFAGKSGALPMLCVFLVKAVGPPLTIAVLVLLAKLPFDVASKTAALSMALAFLIEIMLRLAFASASAGEGVALLLGATCQIAGCLGALVLMRRFVLLAESKGADELLPVPSSAQTRPSALCGMRLRRMWGQTTGRSLLVIVATSLMLGYVRTGASSKGAVEAVAALVVLVALGLAVRCAPRLNARTLLAVAIACVSAAFLLDPFLSIAGPDVGSTLADVGTILFEINIWIMSIAFARSCHRPVLAAAGVRLAAVTGHLAGALIAVGSSAIMGSHPKLPKLLRLSLFSSMLSSSSFSIEMERSIQARAFRLAKKGFRPRVDRRASLGVLGVLEMLPRLLPQMP